MSKKIFFIVLTCCLLVATFCVSFAGAPQVQRAPANVRAVLDRPDCLAAPLIVPPVVEPLNFPVDGTDWLFGAGYDLSYVPRYPFSGLFAVRLISPFFINTMDEGSVYVEFLGFSSGVVIESSSHTAFQALYSGPYLVSFSDNTLILETVDSATSIQIVVGSDSGYAYFKSTTPVALFDADSSLFDRDYVRSLTFSYTTVIINPVIDTLVSGLRSLGANVGRAFSTMAESIFINAEGTGLSTFGILVVVFAAISLGLSLTRWVLNFVTSWGNRNR